MQPLLMCMRFIFTHICILDAIISIYETTTNFKGKNADQIRMTYKAEGDGLQADDICKKGYTYQVFMCTDPAQFFLSKILSPIHDRLMVLFDTVEGGNQQCTMDNIYNSAAFFKGA